MEVRSWTATETAETATSTTKTAATAAATANSSGTVMSSAMTRGYPSLPVPGTVRALRTASATGRKRTPMLAL